VYKKKHAPIHASVIATAIFQLLSGIELASYCYCHCYSDYSYSYCWFLLTVVLSSDCARLGCVRHWTAKEEPLGSAGMLEQNFFYRLDARPNTQPTLSKQWMKI